MIEICPQLTDQQDVLLIPFWDGEIACDDRGLGPFAPVTLGDFTGKAGTLCLEYGSDKRYLLVGLGEKKKAGRRNVSDTYGKAVAHALEKKCARVGMLIPEGFEEGAIDGALTANYAFDHLREKKETRLSALRIYSSNTDCQALCDRLQKLHSGISLCCDLLNGNADDVNPAFLCSEAARLAKKHKKLRVEIFDKSTLEKKGMALIGAVGQAGASDPALITIEYGSGDPIVLVGKGVTYDTGGLNIKTAGMAEMKYDMGGAAAVFGVMEAIASLNLDLCVTALIPVVENGVDSRSYKPGDVFRSYSGKFVEIVNTDAEGRLIMADAITYACREKKPKQIIDIATLTGAMEVALGSHRAGVFSNNNSMREALYQAGEEVGDLVWPMPTDDEYGELIKSKIADIANLGKTRMGGAITAAKFLESFVENGISWAHIDIAGTAYLQSPKGKYRSHATGFGVRLLLNYLEKAHA